VSIRNPRDPKCYLMSHSLAPALVTAANIVQHDLDSDFSSPKIYETRPWQCLYFLPEPQGQTSFRPSLPQAAGSLARVARAAV
jgi:hypothetical protein